MAVGKSQSPQPDHSAHDTLPACPPTIKGTLWYLRMKKQRHNGNFRAVERICCCCSRKIKSYWTAALCVYSPTHRLYWDKNQLRFIIISSSLGLKSRLMHTHDSQLWFLLAGDIYIKSIYSQAFFSNCLLEVKTKIEKSKSRSDNFKMKVSSKD